MLRQSNSLLFMPEVYYHVYKSQPQVCSQSQMNPVHSLQPCYTKMHFNILPYISRSFELSLPFRFPDQNFVAYLIATCMLHSLPISDVSCKMGLFADYFLYTSVQHNCIWINTSQVLCGLCVHLFHFTI